MAVKLIANYSKRLGLPGYSSHQFSVSVETELMTTDDLPGESQRLYDMLQGNVDEQIRETGFVPPGDYGMNDGGDLNGAKGPNGKSHEESPTDSQWGCSERQQELILKLVDEHSLDRNEVEHLARQRFGKGVKQLNKVEASGLIDELIETHSGKRDSNRRPSRGAYSRPRKGGGR